MPEMFFGTLYDTKVPGTSSTSANARMGWVPCPDTGMDAGAQGYSELMNFENGGADIVSAAATHRVYDLEWGTRSGSGSMGLDVIRSYQQRVFGPGLIYFADPMNYETNLFPPHWGTPGLAGVGWKPIAANAANTFPNVTTNAFGYPKRAFTTPSRTASKPTIASEIAVIPVPPGYSLWFCFRNAPGTGTAGTIWWQGINLDGSYATALSTAPAEAGAVAVNSMSGNAYKAVEFWVQGATALVSCMARLYPIGATPPSLSTAQHVPGAGNTGCKFTSAAIVEKYVMTNRTLKGMSTQLTEVGAWQRSGT